MPSLKELKEQAERASLLVAQIHELTEIVTDLGLKYRGADGGEYFVEKAVAVAVLIAGRDAIIDAKREELRRILGCEVIPVSTLKKLIGDWTEKANLATNMDVKAPIVGMIQDVHNIISEQRNSCEG